MSYQDKINKETHLIGDYYLYDGEIYYTPETPGTDYCVKMRAPYRSKSDESKILEALKIKAKENPELIIRYFQKENEELRIILAKLYSAFYVSSRELTKEELAYANTIHATYLSVEGN